MMTVGQTRNFIADMCDTRRIENEPEFEKVLFRIHYQSIKKMKDAAERCIDKEARKELISALGDAEAAFDKLRNLLLVLDTINKNSGKVFK